ncbi:MAG: homoserine kinase [Thermoleophilia bacterium]
MALSDTAPPAGSAPGAVRVVAPATTANLGPGFDCLGLALDLWNVATFTLAGEGVEVRVAGEGSGLLPHGADNLVVRAFRRLFDEAGTPMPPALRIDCEVAVPLASGLGSSAAAIVTGLLGANELLGRPVGAATILALATEVEGHADNVAAALYGGLAVVVNGEEGLLTERIEVRPVEVALAVSQIEYSTRASRAELPTHVALADAVYNMGRAALVVEALRRGDLELLGKAMDDRLHQARRLERMPGGPEAMAAAREAGAAAVAVSGSGPSLIAFPAPGAAVDDVAAAMVAALARAGVRSRPFSLATSDCGAAAHPWPADSATRNAAPRAAAGATRDAAPRDVAAGFELTDHTADVGLRVWAPSEAALFEQAALALSSLVCDPAAVQPRATYSVIAEAPAGSPDALLVAWLNELLYRIDTDGIVFSSFTVEGLTHRYVSARVRGEPLDRERHRPRLDVKAATYHGLSVRRLEHHWEATVVLDV